MNERLESRPELTRTPRGLRRVRTGYACLPPALGTHPRRTAACRQGPAYCTYRLHTRTSYTRTATSTVPYGPCIRARVRARARARVRVRVSCGTPARCMFRAHRWPPRDHAARPHPCPHPCLHACPHPCPHPCLHPCLHPCPHACLHPCLQPVRTCLCVFVGLPSACLHPACSHP